MIEKRRRIPQRLPHIAAVAALLFTLAATTPNRARASGFLIYDLTGEAAGKAGAVSASIKEPAAIWFNPGAISFMPGYRFSVGGAFIYSEGHFDPAGGGPIVQGKDLVAFVPAIFATTEITDWFHAGLGLYVPWGLSVAWPYDWQGREHSISAAIETLIINPTVSFVVWRKYLSIAAGFQLARSVVDLKNGLPETAGGHARAAGGTWGVGANAGILYRIIPEKVHFAVAYRSRIRLKYNKLRVDFAPEVEEFEYELQDQGGKSKLTLPDVITFGLMVKPHRMVELTLDTNVVMWSTFDKIDVDFNTAPDRVMHRNWKNVVTIRLGVNWALPVKGLRVRGGLLFDQNPSPKNTLSPSLPDAHRVGFAMGVGYTWKWIKADLGYLSIYSLPSKAVSGVEGPEGTYRAIAHLLGMTVTFQFGVPEDPLWKEPKPPVRREFKGILTWIKKGRPVKKKKKKKKVGPDAGKYLIRGLPGARTRAHPTQPPLPRPETGPDRPDRPAPPKPRPESRPEPRPESRP